MVQFLTQPLTLAEFLALPASDAAFELIDGQAVPKMSPKFFHSTAQKNLLLLLDPWSQGRGRVVPEWAVPLKRNGNDWVPVPDLLYISYVREASPKENRLPANWLEDAACPEPPELAIEIISPSQTFGEMTEKATDYLATGILRVWILDSQAQSVTIFLPASVPRTYRGKTTIADSLLPDLQLTPQQIFPQTAPA